jgi:hypothetical protein
VTGPLDVVADGVSGVLSRDLGAAARRALTLDRAVVRQHAMSFTWRRVATMFLENIVAANALQGRVLPEAALLQRHRPH